MDDKERYSLLAWQARTERRLGRSLNWSERQRLNELRREHGDFLEDRAELRNTVSCVVAYAYDAQMWRAMRSIVRECFPRAQWRYAVDMVAPRWAYEMI
jgi:hypothetical protein